MARSSSVAFQGSLCGRLEWSRQSVPRDHGGVAHHLSAPDHLGRRHCRRAGVFESAKSTRDAGVVVTERGRALLQATAEHVS